MEDLPATPNAPEASIEPDREQLGSAVRNGLGWSLLNSLVARGLTVAIGLVMARLLVPSDYGVFAVGLVVLNVLQSANELGTSVAVLRWPGDVTRAAGTAMTLAMTSSFVLYSICFFAAPAIADALGSPQAVGVLRLLGVGVVIDGFTTIPEAMFGRSFQQKRRAAIDIGGILVSSTVSIVLAVRGWGPMSLAWGTVAGSVTAAVLVYLMTPYRPRPGFNRDDARALLRVGLPLGGTSLLFLCILNTDYVIVGHALDPQALGFYLLAFNLSMWPSNLLSFAVRRVAIPGFARLAHDPAELARAFGKAFGALASVCLLAIVVLSLLSRSVVSILYGNPWRHSADALQWLAVFGGFRVLIDVSYDLLVAIGRSGRLLSLQLAWLILLIPALTIGVRVGGLAGVGIAHLLVAGGVILPCYLLALRHARISLRPLIAALRRPALALIAGGAVVVLGKRITHNEVSQLLGFGTLGCAMFLSVATPWNEIATWRSRRRQVSLAVDVAGGSPGVGASG